MEQATTILAIVTTEPDALQGGGVPVFITKSTDALQKVSLTLEKTLDAAAHEITPSTMIIVLH